MAAWSYFIDAITSQMLLRNWIVIFSKLFPVSYINSVLVGPNVLIVQLLSIKLWILSICLVTFRFLFIFVKQITN